LAQVAKFRLTNVFFEMFKYGTCISLKWLLTVDIPLLNMRVR